jgi:phytoene/squalene synthetase
MMEVMDFDARRRGRLISYNELNDYTDSLAVAVTEFLHHFYGHGEYAPHDDTRYLAVSAAHITHMLRDTYDDVLTGYFNIPCEVLEDENITELDIRSDAYRAWVKDRVRLARKYFKAGKQYFARVQNLRCQLASFGYIARFEWMLDTIERENFMLRPRYSDRKSAKTGLEMSRLTLASMVRFGRGGSSAQRDLISAQ